MDFDVSTQAYRKALLHLLKFPTKNCIGIFIGKKSPTSSDIVNVTDAIPLFHDHVMAPTLEISLEQVELNLQKDEKIIGLYESIILKKNSEAISSLGMIIAEQIKEKHFSDVLILPVSIYFHLHTSM
jgi:hypothetical protein